MNKIVEIFNSMEYGKAPESTAAATQWLADNNHSFDHFINGQWQAPAGEQHFEAINPANGELLAKIADGTEADVDVAVAAANKAQAKWAGLSGHARARYLYAMARKIQKHARLFAVLESLDNGKPIRESRDIDVPTVVRHFYHHAGWAQVMEQQLPDYQAVGVVGQIIPWNFPLLMLAWKIAPALAMGNTLVLKPAEQTSMTALLFAKICEEIDLPPGVVNIVTGDVKAGEAIVNHKDIDKLAFTGSTDVGRILRRATAGSGKKLSLELGGKSPFIVFEDADLDGVVEGVVDAIWFNQGQVCCAGSRLLVQDSVADKLLTKLKKRMQKLNVSDPLDKNTDMGAIIDGQQCDRIAGLVQKGIDEGATVWRGDGAMPENGSFYQPVILTDVSPSSTVAQDEIFGPVLAVMTFRTHKEALSLANNSRYGLAASVWTENINLALDVAPKLKAGVVWTNCTNQFDAAAGFGGYRESGFGREGGREGLFEYVKPRWEAKLSDKPVNANKSVKTKKAKATAVKAGGIDATAKLYIGGKQARPDGGYTLSVTDHAGQVVGEVPEGNRKDIRNAVEAARKATGWAGTTAHNRAQVLYYIAENLAQRGEEFANRISQLTGKDMTAARDEVEQSISRIYTYAAMADKYDGDVHNTAGRNVTVAMKEALGVMGVVCPHESALLGFVSTVMPAIAMGNNVVAIPSSDYPLLATDFYQILETSDVPAGVVNIVTGDSEELAKVLAMHLDVDGLWYFGSKEGSAFVEEAAAEDMKRTWVNYGKYRDWSDPQQGAGECFLRHATQIKNIWIPYGE